MQRLLVLPRSGAWRRVAAAGVPPRRFCGQAPPAGGGSEPAEASSIAAQKERLRRYKEREGDLAAGRVPKDAEPSLGEYVPYFAISGVIGVCFGLYWYQHAGSADSAEMQKFLAEKEAEPGVVKLPSGLLYRVLAAGAGTAHPAATAPCACDYRGTLVDGTEFDSSHGRTQPAVFSPHQVIKGWTEAMQLMVEGDKWELYVPSSLGYGVGGTKGIPGNSVLIFEMELLQIKGRRVPKREEPEDS